MTVAAPILIMCTLIVVIGAWNRFAAPATHQPLPIIPVARASWSLRRRLRRNRADLRAALRRGRR